MPAHVCHITTIHPSRDVRIFHKECKSLAKAGYEVTLVVVNGESFEEDGVKVIGVPCHFSGRLQRFQKAAKAAYQIAVKIDAGIYHFHDPEFLPYAVKLAGKGKKVLYDVHEDLPRQMLSKHWIPKPVRKVMAFLTENWENRHSKKMTHIITATDFIRDRFLKLNTDVTPVKNFPVLPEHEPEFNWNKKQNKISYVGSIAGVRGISELIRALSICKADITLNLAGTFSPPSYKNELAGEKGWDRVNVVGYAGRDKVKELLGRSFAGMVTLHPIINYLDALPVKMFEYMAAGIPVIASDFPLWRQIVDDAECGICVDPLKPEAIAEAIDFLNLNPEKAETMGKRGQHAVYRKYNWQKEEKKLLEVYSTLEQKYLR